MTSGLAWAGGIVGGAFGGPGGATAGAAAGSALPGILTNLFGGAGRDAQRQARADWFTAMALQGSVLGTRILFGGLGNTAGNESPMYQRALDRVQAERSDVYNAARALGPYWDEHDNASSDNMRRAVQAELLQLSAAAGAAQTPGVQTLPTMQTLATAAAPASSPLVWVLLAAAAIVALYVVLKR